MLVVHVDDSDLASNEPKEMARLMDQLKLNFKFKDFVELSYCLGLNIARDRANKLLYLNQPIFTRNILKKFWSDGPCRSTVVPMTPGLYLDSLSEDENEIDQPYRNLVGALMYLATNTRPDISYSVGAMARFMHKPGQAHWDAAKKVIRS